MTKKLEKIEAEPMWNYMYLTVNKKANVSKSGLIVSTIDVIDMKQAVPFKRHNDPYLNSVAFTDSCLGNFIDKIFSFFGIY